LQVAGDDGVQLFGSQRARQCGGLALAFSLSGMSMWPCRRRTAFQAVSPWRISKIVV
jgi:hypothetical protein